MLKRSITYTNPFTDETVTEDHYFHISKADLVEMQMESAKEPEIRDSTTGEKLEGYQAKLQRIISSEDGKALMEEVKDIIRRSHLVRDGDRQVKNQETWAAFESSEAYSQLFFELCTDAEKAGEFMSKVIPNDMARETAQIAQQTVPATSQGGAADPTGLTEHPTPQVLSEAEVRAMDPEELKDGIATGRYKLS